MTQKTKTQEVKGWAVTTVTLINDQGEARCYAKVDKIKKEETNWEELGIESA